MKTDSNLREARWAHPKPAPVSRFARLTFAIRMGFVEYVDEISPLWYVLGSVCESGTAPGRWRQEWCRRFAWYSSGELTSAMMYSSVRQTSLGVPFSIMNGCRKWKTGSSVSSLLHHRHSFVWAKRRNKNIWGRERCVEYESKFTVYYKKKTSWILL